MNKILIVDDDPITRKALGKMVEAVGCGAIFASDGIRAMNVLEDNPGITLMITDYQMPNEDGITLVKRLRNNPKWDSLKILLCSAYLSIRDIQKLLEDGIEAFLPKPINKKDVQEYILRNLFSPESNNQKSSQIKEKKVAEELPFDPSIQ